MEKKKFDGSEGSFIDVEKSKKMVAKYRELNPKQRTKAHFFGCEVIRDMLDDPRCKGIRIYYAADEKGNPQLVLVGADENMDNILYRTPIAKAVGASAGGNLPGTADESYDCPDFCPSEESDL
ncbi:MAG: hypothetical protein NXI20_01380 [bacterium]|nr:hypothetical protein [bacterium]